VRRRSRDQAAAALAARELDEVPSDGPVLVACDPTDEVVDAAHATTAVVDRWDRRARPSTDAGPPSVGAEPRVGADADEADLARPWPPAGPYRVVALRLPRSWEAFEMALHATLGVLEPGGRLLVYGTNDEGIRSAARRMEPLVGPVGTLAVGGGARLLGAVRPADLPRLRGRLADWRRREPVALPWGTVPWTSYPGVFAHGRLDAGTALLLEQLPAIETGDRVLDYGAGTGFLAAGVLEARPRARVTLLEVDTVAAEAARENVPGTRIVVGPGWAALDPADRFEVVIANPPYHRGKSETLAEIEALVAGAAARLVPGGVLRAVVQRRHGVDTLMERALVDVRAVADAEAFRVWEARAPARSGQRRSGAAG
jgi:16S rRNA (guanine1207-N2)-methyltransferase